MKLLKLVKGFERHHLTQWPEHRKQMMPEHDVEKSVSKSNIEVIGPVATKVCIVVVRKYCLGGAFCPMSSTMVIFEIVFGGLGLTILRRGMYAWQMLNYYTINIHLPLAKQAGFCL